MKEIVRVRAETLSDCTEVEETPAVYVGVAEMPSVFIGLADTPTDFNIVSRTLSLSQKKRNGLMTTSEKRYP